MRYFTLICCFIFSLSSYADELKFEVQLNKIIAHKTTEKSGDELYFSIVTNSSMGRLEHFTVPSEPLYWYSKDTESIKDHPLLKSTLKENESIKIVVSLIERDSPPWLLDDHIGSISLDLTNENGKLKAKWGQPDYVDQTDVTILNDKPKTTYLIKGDDGEYELTFSVI